MRGTLRIKDEKIKKFKKHSEAKFARKAKYFGARIASKYLAFFWITKERTEVTIMGDSQTWNNMDDRERQGLVNSVKRQDQDTSTFVDVSGDTMTGNLEVPTLVASGAVTITGPTQFTNELKSTTLVNSGSVTITGNLDVVAKSTLAANASATNPLTLQHISTIIGGPTIAPLVVIASAASQTFLDFRGAVISTASLALTGANVVGLVRVWYQGSAGNGVGWLPIFKSTIAA